jgi:hypothetical protein
LILNIDFFLIRISNFICYVIPSEIGILKLFDRSLEKEGPIVKEIIQNRKKFFQIQLFMYLLFQNSPENRNPF